MSRLFNRIEQIFKGVLASDPGSRTLQQAGMIRFLLIFIQGVVLVKAGVPLGVVGRIEFVFFVANFLMFYWQSGGQNSLLSWVPRDRDPQEFNRRLGAVFMAMHLFAVVAVVLFSVAWQAGIVEKTGSELSRLTAIYLGIYVFFTLPTSPILYNYLLRSHLRKIIAYISISYALQIFAVLVPVLLGLGVETMMQSLAVYAFLRWVFVVLDGRWFRSGFPATRTVRLYIAFSIPLVLHALNNGLMDYVDGWIVSAFFGEEQFALYRFGAKEFPFNALLIGGLVAGLIPRYAASGKVDDGAVKEEIRKLIRTLVPVNVFLILLSPLIFRYVYSSDFVISARIFNIYALTLISRVVISQVYLYVDKKNWILAASTTAEIVINIALSILLLQWLGLYGIPLATVIAYILHRIFLFAYISYGMGVNPGAYVPLREYVTAIVIMLVAFAGAEVIYY